MTANPFFRAGSAPWFIVGCGALILATTIGIRLTFGDYLPGQAAPIAERYFKSLEALCYRLYPDEAGSVGAKGAGAIRSWGYGRRVGLDNQTEYERVP